MEITLIRHAESEYNEKNLLQGQIDCELSKKGIEQTKDASSTFPQNFDVCFCSPLKRTKYTAEILVPNLPIVYDDLLMERNMGDWQDTPITDEKVFMLKNEQIPPNGESVLDLDKRVAKFLEKLKNQEMYKNVLIITHAGVIYSMQRVLKLPRKAINNLEMLKIEI